MRERILTEIPNRKLIHGSGDGKVLAREQTHCALSSSHSSRGRVLRLKSGYNPNSSSIGSDIPTFLAFAASAGTLTTVLTHLLSEAGERIRARKKAENQGAEEERRA